MFSESSVSREILDCFLRDFDRDNNHHAINERFWGMQHVTIAKRKAWNGFRLNPIGKVLKFEE